MKKRFFAAALAMVLAAGLLTGCNSLGDPEDDEKYWGGTDA